VSVMARSAAVRSFLVLSILLCWNRNAAFTTGAGVNYGSSALVVMNDELSRLGLEPLSGLKLTAGQRLRPAT
jgi:hypothetical protein